MTSSKLFTVAIGFAILCRAQNALVQIKVVKSAPFSAQVITESTQALADGNRTAHKTTAAIWRDGEGRTRREQTGADGGSIVFINDPDSGLSYIVFPGAKLAHKIATAYSKIKSNESVADKGESLGSQVMGGVQVQGSRLVRTLATGEVGNDRPLTVVTEAWYSNELQTVVMRKTTDPRFGETDYTLTDIQRGEPDHSLFEVPAEYTVLDETTAGRLKTTGQSGNK